MKSQASRAETLILRGATLITAIAVIGGGLIYLVRFHDSNIADNAKMPLVEQDVEYLKDVQEEVVDELAKTRISFKDAFV